MDGRRTFDVPTALALRHAFPFVDHVVCLIGPNTIRSRRAVEEIGGVRIGARTSGGGRNSVVYEITAATARLAPTAPPP